MRMLPGVHMVFCKAKALPYSSRRQGKALYLQEVGKMCFTEMGRNGVSNAPSISPSRHLTSSQKEDYQKYCKTELYPVEGRVYCGYNVM